MTEILITAYIIIAIATTVVTIHQDTEHNDIRLNQLWVYPTIGAMWPSIVFMFLILGLFIAHEWLWDKLTFKSIRFPALPNPIIFPSRSGKEGH